MKKIIYPVYLIVVVLVSSEIALRFLHTYDSYFESIGGSYQRIYGITNPTIYHQHKRNKKYIPPNSDYAYSYSTNQFGVREKEYLPKTPDSTIRIFTAGDSFSEGMGAPYDSTWPHLLQKYLNKDLTNLEVFNTGVAGNDPVYDYVFYRDSLRQFKPDCIILSINASDFTDYLMRGGFERINQDGSETFRKSPWYEPVYRYSRWCRVFIHYWYKFPYNGVFASEQMMIENVDSTMKNFTAAIDSFQSVAQKDSTKIIVLFYSTPSEIIWPSKINGKIREEFGHLEEQLNQRGIFCINIWDKMVDAFNAKNISSFTYYNDRHYNPNGYNQMALAIAQKMKEEKMLDK